MRRKRSGPELLVVVRHAKSLTNAVKEEGNPFFADEKARKLVDGIPDHKISLTEEGFRQAEMTGIELRNRFSVFDYVYHSAFLRTIQTMEGVLKAYSAEEKARMIIQMNYLINEKNVGHTYNMTEEEIKKYFPYLQKCYQESSRFFFQPPGGESLMQVAQRVQLFIDILLRNNIGEKILIFTHGGALKCFRFILENLSLDQAESLVNSENCGVTSYRYCSDKKKLVLVNYNEVFWK